MDKMVTPSTPTTRLIRAGQAQPQGIRAPTHFNSSIYIVPTVMCLLYKPQSGPLFIVTLVQYTADPSHRSLSTDKMSPIISEILKITVGPGFKLNSPAFARLREAVVKAGVKEQYYGISMDESDNLFWVIQWPVTGSKGPEQSEPFRESIKALDVDSKPTSWYLPFDNADKPRPALTAPLCQLCALHMNDTSQRATIASSLHKTFTDCYYAPGFNGGYWSTATNDDRMNFYYLGWNSREDHDAFAKTELFAVELDKLMPHMDAGLTHYMEMIQELH